MHLGKAAAPSSVRSVVGMPHKQLGDRAKTSEPKKATDGSSVFTEPWSGIRIV